MVKKQKPETTDEKIRRYRKRRKRIVCALFVCGLLFGSPVPAKAKDYGKEAYDGTRWDVMLEDYLDTKTDRLIFVKYTGGTRASVEMWKKVKVAEFPFSDTEPEDVPAAQTEEAETKTDWEKIVSCKAYVGANGLYKKKEGDRKTPVGIYNITMAFGRKKSPGTAGISYTKLNKYHYWSDEKATYNQFVDVRTLNRRRMSGEHLINYNPHYNYVLAMDYNKKCTYKKGAAIFLHCFGGNTYTAGCIAVPEKNMKRIVQNTTKHTKICIYRK